jgi:hypothetical protein
MRPGGPGRRSADRSAWSATTGWAPAPVALRPQALAVHPPRFWATAEAKPAPERNFLRRLQGRRRFETALQGSRRRTDDGRNQFDRYRINAKVDPRRFDTTAK